MAIIAVTYVYGGDPQALTEHRPRHRDFLRELLAEKECNQASLHANMLMLYLDGGLVIGGRSSTIVDMTSTPPRIVRPGPVSHAELVAVVDDLADAGG